LSRVSDPRIATNCETIIKYLSEGSYTAVRDTSALDDVSAIKTENDEVDDCFSTIATLQGQSSVGMSHLETLIGAEQMSSEAKDSLDDDEAPDAGSISSHDTTPHERDGKAEIAHFLATDPELRAICSTVIGKIDEADFADTGSRLLKHFYLELLREAQSELQIQTVRLLKSQKGRVRISKEIAEIIILANAEDAEDKRREQEQTRMRKERLETFLSEKSFHQSGAETEAFQDDDEGDDENKDRVIPTQGDERAEDDEENRDARHDAPSEPASSNENQENTRPNLLEMKTFFRKSKAFQLLLHDFSELLVPPSLRDIDSATPIKLSSEEDNTLINCMKVWVEEYTLLVWNWWPLEPCMRRLKSNESRLIWYCVSKERITNTLSLFHTGLRNATLEGNKLQRSGHHPAHAP
jgi:hypothetical protein